MPFSVLTPDFLGAAPLNAWDKMHLTGALLAPAFNKVDAYISYAVRLKKNDSHLDVLR